MENFTDVKLEIFVPREYAFKIRDELSKIGVGRIGSYDHCVAISAVQGYYRPLPGADPFEAKLERSVKLWNTRLRSIASANW